MGTLTTWNPTLSVGNAKIDGQHQMLLALHLRAIELAQPDQSAFSNDEFHDLLNNLVELAESHFAAEEAILTRNHCPNVAAHKAIHDTYIDHLGELIGKAMDNEIDRTGLRDFLADNLAHLLQTDMEYKEYMVDHTGKTFI